MTARGRDRTVGAAAAAARLHARLAELAASGAFRGSVRLEQRGEPLLDEGYGEDASGLALTPATCYQIASISKSFVAACVLVLADDDRLALADPLCAFVEQAPEAWRPITVHHLLDHTSGIGHWQEVGVDLFHSCPRSELIARFAHAPLLFEPGRSWSYSSPGYVLLAQVVEVAAGAPYASVLEQRVLGPLGLRATRVALPPQGAPAARGSSGGSPAPSFELASVCVGTGDLWSCTGDLARWPRLVALGDLLSPGARQALLAPQAHVADERDGLEDVAYGYGWFLARCAGRRVVLHPGDQPGFTSLLAWAPDDDLVLAALAADELELGALLLPSVVEALDGAGAA
jgi:CubicO group peptidase (beta-lactamase class C family)